MENDRAVFPEAEIGADARSCGSERAARDAADPSGWQRNITVSDDCAAAFAAIAEARGVQQGGAVEDVMAEQLGKLEGDGEKFEIGGRS